MSTFVLVHGAWHGAWCWERLEPELHALGHATVTMDLPAEDGSATFEDYADVVLDAMPSHQDVVLVGHSLGGMAIPLVAARRRARALVFLCGVVPAFGAMPWDGGPDMEEEGALVMTRHEDGSMTIDTVEAATRAFYHDCEPADAAWAFSKLRAQNSSSLWNRPYPLTEWPDARRVSITCEEDRIVRPEWARFAAGRLGVEPILLPGSHSPFLSRPRALAETLQRAVFS